jgi:hypothetical protein
MSMSTTNIPLFLNLINKGNNKITELRTIFQRYNLILNASPHYPSLLFIRLFIRFLFLRYQNRKVLFFQLKNKENWKKNNHSECMMNLVIYIIDTSCLNKSFILYFGLNIYMRYLSYKKKTRKLSGNLLKIHV